MRRLGLLVVVLVVPLLVPHVVRASASSPLTVSTVSNGVRLTLTVPRRVYAANALTQVTVRVRNVSRHLLSLLPILAFLPVEPVRATTSSRISVSTVSADGVRLTLTLPRSVYPLNALVRATVRIQNVGQQTVFTRIGDGCTSTNPVIEVFDRQGRVMDQGPSVAFGNPGCKHVLGQPFRPRQVVVRHVFAVLRGP